jgi:DNA anti-recombination protein RmuC
MTFWAPLLAVSTMLAAAGFVVVAVLWLKKLRHTLQAAMGEMASHQVHNSQRVNEATVQLQKQQRALEQQIQTLGQANLRLRQDITDIIARLEHTEREQAHAAGERILH